MSEGKGKASELRERQNGAFVSVLPLASGHPLSASLPGSQRDPLCLSCTTKIKTEEPDPAAGLQVLSTPWDTQHHAETRSLPGSRPDTQVSDTCFGQAPTRFGL